MQNLATALQLQGDTFSPVFAEAFAAWKRGWSIIPCRADKRPDAELLRAATGAAGWAVFQTRQATIQELFTWQDAAAFGCVTGAISGVVVLDVDSRDAGILKGKHLPPTLVAETPRGLHYYYRSPLGGLATKAGILPQVDVRGEHGYTVMPGPVGRAWAAGLDDAEGLADVPKWLLALAKPGAGPKPKQAALPKRKPATIAQEPPRSAPVAVGSMAGTLSKWYSSPEVALQLAPLLGIESKGMGKACRDILPGLPADKKPSAELYQTERGVVLYRSFRLPDSFYTLGEVRASIAYGKPTKLVKRTASGGIAGMSPEGVCWSIRLLVEGGLIQAAKVAHRPLTDDAPESARKAYKGFLELLGCKWLYHKGEPSPFSWRFAAAWCGMGHRQAGEGMQWLLSNGYLIHTGSHRRTALFMPRMETRGSE